MRQLYEVSQDMLEVMSLDIDELTRMDTLAALEGEFGVKAEKIVHLIRNNQADIEAHKNEEKRIAERRKQLEKQTETLEAYLYGEMKVSGLKELKSPLFKLTIQKNPPKAEVLDESLIPSNFMIPQDPKLDKKLLLKALKDGEEIPGAVIVQETRLQIK
jgi:hypothetical protein